MLTATRVGAPTAARGEAGDSASSGGTGLVGKLAATVEGPETALDHSVILTANDMAEGASHSVDHIPFALIGSCGGYLKTGQALHLDSQPHNLLLATICNAMDVPVMGYGQKYSGTLQQIVA